MGSIIKDLIFGTGGANEYPIVRAVRTAAMVGISAAVGYLLTTWTAIDFPGDYDVLWVLAGTSGLTWLDKWLRGHSQTTEPTG